MPAHPPDPQEGYAWNPADYADNSAMQHGLAQELLARLALEGCERVLDLGCGNARVTADLAARLPAGAVVGVDRSPAMIRYAQEQYPPARFPNLTFAVMDAQALRFDRAFDLVVSFAALHWVPDHRAVLAGIAASLKPGGRILLQFGGQGNVAAVLAVVGAVSAHPAWRPYFRDFVPPRVWHRPAVYRGLLEQTGLYPARLALVPKDLTLAGPAGFAGWLRTAWVPYVGRVPPAEQAAFLAAVTDAYLAQFPPAASRQIHVAMVRLEVEAVQAAPAG